MGFGPSPALTPPPPPAASPHANLDTPATGWSSDIPNMLYLQACVCAVPSSGRFSPSPHGFLRVFAQVSPWPASMTGAPSLSPLPPDPRSLSPLHSGLSGVLPICLFSIIYPPHLDISATGTRSLFLASLHPWHLELHWAYILFKYMNGFCKLCACSSLDRLKP